MILREGCVLPLLVVTCSEIDFDVILKYIINQRIMRIFSHFLDELLAKLSHFLDELFAILSHFLDEVGYVLHFY